MKETLCLGTLGDIGHGSARALIDHEIRLAVADFHDRAPQDGKSRKVMIELEIAQGKGGSVEFDVTCHAKLPPRRSIATIGNLKDNGGQPLLQFQTMSPDDPDQDNFPVLDENDDGETPTTGRTTPRLAQ